MFFPDPVFHPGFPISDPTTTEKRKGKRIYCLTFFAAINFTKLIILFMSRYRKKFEPTD
jgi:hypothetical protein